jgi:hypothetical protein
VGALTRIHFGLRGLGLSGRLRFSGCRNAAALNLLSSMMTLDL